MSNNLNLKLRIWRQDGPDAPGVYVEKKKIASIGLRIRRGASYHGLALNVAMDLEPFTRINPCGYAGLQMTQLSELGGPTDLDTVAEMFLRSFVTRIENTARAEIPNPA